MNANCFVIMPYGVKKDSDGKKIDFDWVYRELIEKAVAKIDGLECLRCIDIEQAGSLHKAMLSHIVNDRIAIVDSSTHNANVFYELGLRHALKKSGTILIHRKGTDWPFNIQGLNSIEYTPTPDGLAPARKRIRTFIENALQDPEHVDSLLYTVLPELPPPARQPVRLTRVQVFEFPLQANPEMAIAIVTGDQEQIKICDVWVSSENTDMQMDRYYETSTSATIRYLGAQKHPDTGRVVEDTIGLALARKMGGERQVDPGTILTTESGALAANNVKYIFHAASVIGQPRGRYRAIERIERCVTNALAKGDSAAFREQGLKSILFPMMGTGPAGGDLKDHATRFVNAAVEYLEANPDSNWRRVCFHAWSDVNLEVCRRIAGQHPGLRTT